MMRFRSVICRCLGLCAGVALVPAVLAQASGDRFEGIRARPVGPLRNIGGVGYIAPEGWQVTQQGAAAVLVGPVKKEWQPCVIVIDPTVPPSDDLASQAEMVVNANFGRNFGRYHGEAWPGLGVRRHRPLRDRLHQDGPAIGCRRQGNPAGTV